MDFESFKRDNRVSNEDWELASIDWELLCAIGEHHDSNVGELTHTAQYCANVLQACSAVHSVRWRIKDAQHLLEKIIRKRAEGVEKYLSISLANYQEVVTDLVGIRALHLFKDEYRLVDEAVRRQWDLKEIPIIYHRGGDDVSESDEDQLGFSRKEHAAGYRSVHYVFGSSPGRQQVLVELQVRTIFEEGWSEIDHRVRYPNYSDNALIGYFLGIFNRMAGSADEMGAYVKNLARSLEKHADEIQALRVDYDQKIEKLESDLKELRDVSEENEKAQNAIKRMERQLVALKLQSPTDLFSGVLNTSSDTGLMDFASIVNNTTSRSIDAYLKTVLNLDSINASARFAKELSNISKHYPKKPDGL